MGRRRRGIDTRVKILGMVILAVLVANYVLSADVMTTGYDGLTAEIIGVEGEDPNNNADLVRQTNDGLIATYDAGGYLGVASLIGNPTGVKMEIQGRANIMSWEPEGEPITEVFENEDGTFTQKVWKQYIVKCEIGVMVTTTGIGESPALNTIFTVAIQENAFNIFSAPDSTIAYIIEAYVVSVTESTTLMKVSPASGGMYVGLKSLELNPVPSWILEGGYQEPLATRTKASFDLKVDFAQPSTTFGWNRVEQTITWIIGIDMLTFGLWEDTGPNKEFDPPEADWWETILNTMPVYVIIGVVLVAGVIVLIVVSRFWIMMRMASAGSK